MKHTTKKFFNRGTVSLTYDLSNPDEVYAYRCALNGLNACLLLESMKAYTEASVKDNVPYLALLADLRKDLDAWEVV